MDNLVSIIVPVYNAASTLRRCVESIVKNDYDNVEIILIDDCSKDESLLECQTLSKEYDYVLYYHNEVNKGVSYTRNKGLQYCNGKYVLFIDSDDYIEPDYIAKLVSLKDKHNDSLVLCGYINEDMKYNQSVDYITYSDNSIDILDIKSIDELYNRNLLQQLWNKIFIRSVIHDNNIKFDESISVGEDLKFILEYIIHSHYKNVYFLNQSLYHYMRDQSTSLMYNVNSSHLHVNLQNMKTLYEYIGKSKEEINQIITTKRNSLINNYAYMILRNRNMSYKDKKKNIYDLDAVNGKKLFKNHVVLYLKEKIRKYI